MNVRALYGLIREQWRSTYRLFAIALTVCVSGCIGANLFLARNDIVNKIDENTLAGVAIGSLHLGHILWIMFLVFSASETDDLRISMPRFLMRLPVSAWTLVSARLAFGVVSMLGLSLIGTSLYYGLFDARMEQALPFASLMIVYPTLYAVIQAAAWVFGPFGIGVTVAAILFGSIIPNWLFFDFGFAPMDHENYSPPGAAAAILTAFLASGIAVAEHRRGRFVWFESLPGLISVLRRRRTGADSVFSSPEAALRWYQYRRQWRLIPAMLIAFFTCFFVIHLFWYHDTSGTLEEYEIPLKYVLSNHAERLILAFYAALVVGTLFLSGIFFFQNRRMLTSKERAFLFIRPVTVKTLAATRFDSCVRSIAAGLVPLLALVAVACFFDLVPGRYDPVQGRPVWDTVYGHLTSVFPRYQVIAMTLFTFCWIFAAVWAGLWLENLVVIGVIFGGIALVIENHPSFIDTPVVVRSNYTFYITSGIVVAASVAMFWSALRQGLVKTKQFLLTIAVLPIACTGFMLYMNNAAIIEGKPVDYSYLTTTMPLFLAAVMAPLATAPLLMQWSRHRS